MIELPPKARVYADSNIWIYHLENARLWTEPVGHFLSAITVADARLVTSELTWAECIYKPARDDDAVAMATFDRFFSGGFIEIIAVEGEDLMEAAREGGKLGLRLLDSVHFLAARKSGCTHFVTSDRRFRSTPDVEAIVLSPIETDF
jgi:predicted nucleic acid-binding protein